MFLRSTSAAITATTFCLLSSPVLAQVSFIGNTGGTLRLSAQGNQLTTDSNAIVSIEVQPSTSAAVFISEPIFISGSTVDPAGSTKFASAVVGGNTITSSGSGSAPLTSSPTSITVTDIPISMEIQRPILFPSGTYVYQVIMTVTVN